MSLEAHPFDGQTDTEDDWALYSSNVIGDGFVGMPGGDAGELVADTGMQVKVQQFDLAMVHGFFASSDADESVTLNSGGGSDRTDRVVLRVDPTENKIEVGVLKGTSMTPPSLTQVHGGVWEIPIARVHVKSGAANVQAKDITDERDHLSTRVVPWTTDTRQKVEGQVGFNVESGMLEVYDGSKFRVINAWADITGKPATFPPSTHSHAWSQITGKPATFPPAPHSLDSHTGDSWTGDLDVSGTVKQGGSPVATGGGNIANGLDSISNSDNQSTFQNHGVTTSYATSQGFPNNSTGAVFTVRASNLNAFQLYFDRRSYKLYSRVSNDSGNWESWSQIFPPRYADFEGAGSVGMKILESESKDWARRMAGIRVQTTEPGSPDAGDVWIG